MGVDARSITISPDGKTALLIASAAGQANLYTYVLDEVSTQPIVARQLTSTPGGKSNAQFTADNKEVYYLENGRINVVTLESRTPRAINVTAELDVDFAREKLALFRQGWSILADNFFDAKMNGVDWRATGDRYEQYAAGRAEHRGAAPHHAAHGRRVERVALRRRTVPSFSPQTNVGRLGVRFDRGEYERAGKLRVTETLTLSPAALAGSWPGDYIVSVDGARVDVHTNLDSVLLNKINRRVERRRCRKRRTARHRARSPSVR